MSQCPLCTYVSVDVESTLWHSSYMKCLFPSSDEPETPLSTVWSNRLLIAGQIPATTGDMFTAVCCRPEHRADRGGRRRRGLRRSTAQHRNAWEVKKGRGDQRRREISQGRSNMSGLSTSTAVCLDIASHYALSHILHRRQQYRHEMSSVPLFSRLYEVRLLLRNCENVFDRRCRPSSSWRKRSRTSCRSSKN